MALGSMDLEPQPPMKYSLHALARHRESMLKKLETLAFGGHVTEERHKEPPDPLMEISTPRQGWKPPPSRTTAPATTSPRSIHRRMEPPRFTGMDASNWIIKIQSYFNHTYTPESDRLYLVTLLFDPSASDWAAYWKENNSEKGWDDFLIAVKHRFDPNLYEGYIGTKTTIEPPDPPAFPSDTRWWGLPPSLTQPPTGVVPVALPRPCFDAPRFDGENVVEWIHNIQKYYNHCYTPLSDRLYLIKYLFDQPASDWLTCWKYDHAGEGWDDFLLAVYHRFAPGMISHVVDDHQLVDQPSIIEPTKNIISNGMAMNTIDVDIVTTENNGSNMDCILVDINPIDDSLIDEACSKALNINNGVIATDDIEENQYTNEQSAQVQALAETDFCTDFLDSVNSQSEVPADPYLQPVWSRGGPKDRVEEATNKEVSMDLDGQSSISGVLMSGSYIANPFCTDVEREAPSTWDPGESTCIPRSNSIESSIWAIAGGVLYNYSQGDFLKSWTLVQCSLLEMPIPSSVPGMKSSTDFADALDDFSDALDSCIRLATSRVYLTIDVIDKYDISHFHPVYEVRSHKALVPFLWLGGQQLDFPAIMSSARKTSSPPGFPKHRLPWWELNLLWCLNQYMDLPKLLTILDIEAAFRAFNHFALKWLGLTFISGSKFKIYRHVKLQEFLLKNVSNKILIVEGLVGDSKNYKYLWMNLILCCESALSLRLVHVIGVSAVFSPPSNSSDNLSGERGTELPWMVNLAIAQYNNNRQNKSPPLTAPVERSGIALVQLQFYLLASVFKFVEFTNAHIAVEEYYRFVSRQFLLLGTWLDLSGLSSRKAVSMLLQVLLHEVLDHDLDEIRHTVILGNGSNLDEVGGWIAVAADLCLAVHAISREFEWVVLNIVDAAGGDSRYKLQWFQAPASKSTSIEANTSGTPSVETDPMINLVDAGEELEVQIALVRASLDTCNQLQRKHMWLVVTCVLLQFRALAHRVIKLIVCYIFVVSALRTRRLLSGRELIGTSSPKPKRPTKPWPDIFYC